MSYYAVLDNEANSGGDVATNNGWAMFVGWVEDLEGELPALKQLCDDGYCDDLDGLESDLTTALDQQPDESSKSIGVGLLEMLKNKADAEVIVVTDGVGVEA